RLLLLFARRRGGRHGCCQKLAGNGELVFEAGLATHNTPQETESNNEYDQYSDNPQIELQIKMTQHQRSCSLANTYPAPRTVMIRRGFFGSSSMVARIREMCTSTERSKASSASPF